MDHQKANGPSGSLTAVLYDRPEGEIPSGLRQEARDPCTRVGNQIIDTFDRPLPLHTWVWAWKEQAGSKAEGIGAVTLKEEAA